VAQSSAIYKQRVKPRHHRAEGGTQAGVDPNMMHDMIGGGMGGGEAWD
jgi:hypothetical protein